MFVHTLFLLLFITTPLHCWSIKESVQETYNTVSSNVTSWFERTKKEIVSKEYPVEENSRITITNKTGAITITTWKKNSVMIETNKKGREKELPNTIIAIGNQGPDVAIMTETRDGSKPVTVDYKVIVPENAQLTIQTEYGAISTKDTKGDIHAQTLSGNITIMNSSGSVSAKTPKGSIKLEQITLDSDESIFLEAYRNIELILSQDIDASLNAKTLSGIITSDIYITLNSITTKLSRVAWKRIKQDIRGIIGAGGSPITLDTTKGNIAILEL